MRLAFVQFLSVDRYALDVVPRWTGWDILHIRLFTRMGSVRFKRGAIPMWQVYPTALWACIIYPSSVPTPAPMYKSYGHELIHAAWIALFGHVERLPGYRTGRS